MCDYDKNHKNRTNQTIKINRFATTPILFVVNIPLHSAKTKRTFYLQNAVYFPISNNRMQRQEQIYRIYLPT